MFLRWAIRKTPDGWSGTIDLPAGMQATGQGKTKAEAVRSATALARAALSNPAVQAALPPGAGAALQAASIIARSPAARAAASVVKSAGLRKLAKALSW